MNSKTQKNILITGGCGFIGVNLVNYLLRKGFKNIRILDNLSIATNENLEDAIQEIREIISIEKIDNKIFYKLKDVTSDKSNNHDLIEIIIGDIRNYDICLEATKNISGVVHLAAHAGVVPSIKNPFHDFEVNVKGTLNLLHAAKTNKLDKFIFASSNAPLGNHDPPLNENKIPRPLSPYGASKLASEAYCSAFYRSYGLKTIVLRFSNVYGLYCLHKNSVVAKFIRDSLLKGELTIYGDGTQTREFIYVEDISRAIYLILTARIEQASHMTMSTKYWGTPIHLGTGKETKVRALAELVKNISGKKIKISFAPERKGEIKRNYTDTKTARNIMGFSPQINLEDGVNSVYKWFMTKDINKIRNTHILSGSE